MDHGEVSTYLYYHTPDPDREAIIVFVSLHVGCTDADRIHVEDSTRTQLLEISIWGCLLVHAPSSVGSGLDVSLPPVQGSANR